jgi:DNA-binding transcriptional LysR family regulator
LPDSSLLAKRLCGVRLALVGSPGYFQVHGRPTHPRDLVWHRALTYAYALTPETWRFVHATEGEQAVTVSGPLKVNNSDALLPTLKAGLGLALLPEFIVWPELADGSVESVMCDWRPPPIALNLVSPPGRLRPARVRVLHDFLAERLATAAWALPE